MVQSCGAINCNQRRNKGVKLKFHQIPNKDITLRKAWLHALRRANYDPKCGCVCEKHFKENDYYINVHGNKVLKPGTVPSVFNFPPHLIKVVKGRRTLKRTPFVPEQQNEDNVIPSTNCQVQMDAENNDLTDTYTAPVDVSVLQNVNESAPQSSTSKIKENQSISRKINERDPICFGDFKESNIENDFQENDSEINVHGNKVVPGPQNEDEVRLNTNCGNLLQIDAENNGPVIIASADIAVLQNINESAPQASTSKIKENQPISRDFKESNIEIVFQESDFEINVHGNKVVEKGAALSVLNFPPHVRKPCVPDLLQLGPQNEDEIRLNTNCGNVLQIDAQSNDSVNIASSDISVLQTINESAPQASTSKIKETQPISRKRNARYPVFFGDFKESDLEDKIKRERFWDVAQAAVWKYRKERKFYESKIGRQKSQISKLKALLKELREEKKSSSTELLVIQVEP